MVPAAQKLVCSDSTRGIGCCQGEGYGNVAVGLATNKETAELLL